MTFKRRHPLSARDAKALALALQQRYGGLGDLPKGSKIELAELPSGEAIYIVNGSPLIVKVGDVLAPSLLARELTSKLAKVVVDMGAVPHIANGADVMAPGVRGVRGEFGVGDVVVVVDERYGKELAVGQALKSHLELPRERRGKVVKNLHYVGDRIWKALQQLAQR